MSCVSSGHTCAILTAQGAGAAGRSQGGVGELIAGVLVATRWLWSSKANMGSGAWRGSEHTALRSMGLDTGSPKSGQLSLPNPGARQQGTHAHHAPMLTLGPPPPHPRHSCPTTHPGHSPSDPQTQLPEAKRLTVQLALHPLHHKLLPLGPDSSENSLFPFQPDFHHGSHLWIE